MSRQIVEPQTHFYAQQSASFLKFMRIKVMGCSWLVILDPQLRPCLKGLRMLVVSVRWLSRWALLVHNYHGFTSGAAAHGSFPLFQGEGRDGVLLCALIVKTE